MVEVKTLRIRNWDRYQHYKDRCPPWIKLYFDLLTSRDWVMLDNAGRVLAVACMLLASRSEGDVPADAEYIQRVAYLHELPNLQPLIACGFFELPDDASKLHTSAIPETETETETETEKKGKRKRFTPPTLEEVTTYCRQRHNAVNPQKFMAHYESNGWKVGRNAMKNWKAAVVNWEGNEFNRPKTNPADAPSAPDLFIPGDYKKYGEHARWDEYCDIVMSHPTVPPGSFAEWEKTNA